jgi:hypothetical protein
VNIHGVDHIRLQFDDLILQYRTSTGWQVSRGGHVVIQYASWEEAWDSLTTPERVRCIVFTNQLR